MNTYNGISFDKKWITDGITEQTIKWAEGLGKHLTVRDELKPMTTSQLRRFFGEVKRIENDFDRNKEDIHMLLPMLAYAVGRKNDTKIKDFETEMKAAILAVNNSKDNYTRFVKIFESIVAYHKYNGGKEN
jgi:CRISPR-associated protein Csm2